MNQQILSQDEVDALLQGITGESQKLEQEDAPKEGIRDYNLAQQERIVRGRMPTMEIINERFARNVRVGLFNLIRKSPEVSIGVQALRAATPGAWKSRLLLLVPTPSIPSLLHCSGSGDPPGGVVRPRRIRPRRVKDEAFLLPTRQRRSIGRC